MANHTNPIDSADSSEQVGQKALNGSALAVGAALSKTGIQIVSAAILARLLAPADFGLVATAVGVTGIMSLFLDFGLSAATIQQKNLDSETASTLFWINFGAGLVVMLLIIAAAPVVAHFFHDQRLFWIIVVSSFAKPLEAATVQHRAILQRHMRWSAVQRVDLATAFVGSCAAVLLALTVIDNYWAIVAAGLIAMTWNVLHLWQENTWRPGALKKWVDVRPAVFLGVNLGIANTLNYVQRQLDNLIIGYWWGPSHLGQYTRAYGLFLMPLTLLAGPVSSAVLPALCRAHQSNQEWRTLYLKSLSILVMLTAPIAAGLILTAPDLIPALFGDQWEQSISIFQALAIAMFVQPTMSSTGWVYVALGRTDRMLRWTIFATPITVLSFFVGVPYGAFGVAVCFAGASVALFLPCIIWAFRDTGLRLSEIFKATIPQTACAIVSMVLVFALIEQPMFAEVTSTWIRLFWSGGLFSLFYTVFLASAIMANLAWLKADEFLALATQGRRLMRKRHIA